MQHSTHTKQQNEIIIQIRMKNLGYQPVLFDEIEFGQSRSYPSSISVIAVDDVAANEVCRGRFPGVGLQDVAQLKFAPPTAPLIGIDDERVNGLLPVVIHHDLDVF